MIFASLNLFALDGPSTPSGSGRGNQLQCKYYDEGWEEHGYHNSCQECHKKHGDCEERCYSYTYTCKVTGRDKDGNIETFTALGANERRVGDEAIDRCYQAGSRNCYLDRCDESSRLESRHTCKDEARPNSGNNNRPEDRPNRPGDRERERERERNRDNNNRRR